MRERQFFTTCRYCGRQILMTRNVDTGRFIPCDPLIVRFIPDEESDEWFINEHGQSRRGFDGDGIGAVGYRRHTARCRGRMGA